MAANSFSTYSLMYGLAEYGEAAQVGQLVLGALALVFSGDERVNDDFHFTK